MSLGLAFHPHVQRDVTDAYLWYEQQREGLGEDFLAAIHSEFAQLQENPKMYQEIYKGVHRVIVRRFPYGVIYQIKPEYIAVIAVVHVRRDPQYWQSRL